MFGLLWRISITSRQRISFLCSSFRVSELFLEFAFGLQPIGQVATANSATLDAVR